MRGFTFKSLKSLKAPGLDGFDISLLNLHWERKQESVGVGADKRKRTREEPGWGWGWGALVRRIHPALAVMEDFVC